MRYFFKTFLAFGVALLLGTGLVAAQYRFYEAPTVVAPVIITPIAPIQSFTPLDTRTLAAPQAPAVAQPACNYRDSSGYYHRC